jgi:murein DD-endopeptidase MepM/ murein hydrolase activator NlpD
VVIAGTPESGYGIQVELDHGFGYRTKYAHLSKLKVKVGDKVKRGDVIGLSGNTGYSTGPHLHYEVIKFGQKVNPLDYFYTN